MPMPETPAQIPMARARSLGSWNTVVSTESVAGKMHAPPSPMRARAAISWPGVEASDASAEQTPNHATPNSRMRRRPNRSPMAPAVSRRHAKTMV